MAKYFKKNIEASDHTELHSLEFLTFLSSLSKEIYLEHLYIWRRYCEAYLPLQVKAPTVKV